MVIPNYRIPSLIAVHKRAKLILNVEIRLIQDRIGGFRLLLCKKGRNRKDDACCQCENHKLPQVTGVAHPYLFYFLR